MRLSAVLIAALCALGPSCGYVDDNPRAARSVAQALLDAYAEHDASGICRVLAPEVQVAVAATGTCEAGISPQLEQSYPRLTVGGTRAAPSPPGNPRLFVAVREQPGREIQLGRYGSTWRVIHGGKLP